MKIKIVSSLEKCFPDQNICDFRTLESASLFKNELFSFQLAIMSDVPVVGAAKYWTLSVEGVPAESVRCFRVRNVASAMPIYQNAADDDYLRQTPGLFPDALIPMPDATVPVTAQLSALWFDITDLPPGDHELTVRLSYPGGKYEPAEAKLRLHAADALLPPQTTKATQWFHCDCLMTRYGCKAFDEEHWRIIGNFVKTYAEHGLNMILTPLFTPPLDTQVGGERPTVQLVDVAVKNGVYSFGFDRLERWIRLCGELGIKWFEMSHLFTQWGAAHCPKIMADTENGYRRIFGWENDAAGNEYREFLVAFVPELLKKLRELGVADRCYFHLSDEPSRDHLDNYRAARDILVPLLEGAPVIDALSDPEFYDMGLVKIPVPANDHIEAFLERDIEERWTYYCCGQCQKVSNRFFAMPSHRTRIMGAQMYKFGVEGFLQWGYNFWYDKYSRHEIDPWSVTDGDGFFPSGDGFSVYPGPGGSCISSLRLKVFLHGLQDIRALKLCESLIGRDETLKLVDADMPLTFSSYPRDPGYILRLREKINAAVEAAMAKRD